MPTTARRTTASPSRPGRAQSRPAELRFESRSVCARPRAVVAGCRAGLAPVARQPLASRAAARSATGSIRRAPVRDRRRDAALAHRAAAGGCQQCTPPACRFAGDIATTGPGGGARRRRAGTRPVRQRYRRPQRTTAQCRERRRGPVWRRRRRQRRPVPRLRDEVSRRRRV